MVSFGVGCHYSKWRGGSGRKHAIFIDDGGNMKVIISLVVFLFVTWGGMAIFGAMVDAFGDSWQILAYCMTYGPLWVASLVWMFNEIMWVID